MWQDQEWVVAPAAIIEHTGWRSTLYRPSWETPGMRGQSGCPQGTDDSGSRCDQKRGRRPTTWLLSTPTRGTAKEKEASHIMVKYHRMWTRSLKAINVIQFNSNKFNRQLQNQPLNFALKGAQQFSSGKGALLWGQCKFVQQRYK